MRTTMVVPSQNPGTEMKIIAILRAIWSPMVSWRIAEYMPMGTPISRDTSRPRIPSSSVTGTLMMTSSTTEVCCHRESPSVLCRTRFFEPAHVLDMNRHVEAELLFEVCPGDVGEVVHPRRHHINDVARNEAYDEEDYQGDEKERRYD